MLQTALITPAMMLIGWSIFVRRYSWRFRWDRMITLGVAFQAAGLLLCAPDAPERQLGAILFEITGVTHVRDYFGHLCFISAAVAVVCALICRLVPDAQVETVMRRVEWPCAGAALVMLICLTSSNSLTAWHGHADFFQEPRDLWLTIYWFTYMGIVAYVLGYMVRLLLILRQDPRSRTSATTFIAAIAAGSIAMTAVIARLIDPTIVSSDFIWGPLGVASSLSAFASAWSWRSRIRRLVLG